MRKLLSVILAAGLLVSPFATFAADYGSQTSQTQQAPPVAQALVREGDFAVKLAAELDLGKPTDEAVAEEMLAKAGVAPVNGWLSDYPMTPEILGQLQDSIAKAAAAGKLQMTTEQATKGLYNLASQMNLPTPAGEGSASAKDRNVPAEQTSPTVINNYYYDQGPPVITYYPPPADYVYLYDWVPYPVFWFGFWFPGFFICDHFTTTVFVTNAAFVTRTAIVSNHVIDPVTRTSAVVSPVSRTRTGTVQAATTLRTGSGKTFNTVAEMSTWSRTTAGKTGTAANSAPRTQGFRSPDARKSAGAIYSRSLGRTGVGSVREGAVVRSGERPYVSPGTPGRSYNAPSRGGTGGRSIAPGRQYNIRQYNSPSWSGERRSVAPSWSGRQYNAPSWGGERRYSAPGWTGRSFGGSVGPVIRGGPGGGPVRSFPGTGWRGR